MNINLIGDIVAGVILVCMAIVVVFTTYMCVDMMIVYLKNFRKGSFNNENKSIR